MNAFSSIPRNKIVDALGRLRKDWQEAAGADSLVITLGSVGCILADLTILLELTREERQMALSAKLIQELEQAGVLAADEDIAIEWVPENWVLAE